jgi:hypothetical protein
VDVLATDNVKKRKYTDIQNGKGETKLYLFTADMILYVGNLKQSGKNKTNKTPRIYR